MCERARERERVRDNEREREREREREVLLTIKRDQLQTVEADCLSRLHVHRFAHQPVKIVIRERLSHALLWANSEGHT
jgi:hypothetical protein